MTDASGAAPIVMLSVFKGGTHLMRRVLTDMTGLPFYEPPIVPGKVDYRDPEQLRFVPGHYYSWHLVPTAPIRERLVAAGARPVLVLRNIYDLVVSIYHHFAENIDADIGRGRNVDHYFRELSREAGLEAIITGMTRPDFRWQGIGPQANHLLEMLELAALYPSFVTTFERLTRDKPGEVARLARFLGVDLSAAARQAIVGGSSFEAMKAAASARGEGSHYRRGQAASHVDELTPHHRELIAVVLRQQAPDFEERARQAGFPELCDPTGRK